MNPVNSADERDLFARTFWRVIVCVVIAAIAFAFVVTL